MQNKGRAKQYDNQKCFFTGKRKQKIEEKVYKLNVCEQTYIMWSFHEKYS